jgi:hypothetical protein
MKTRPEIDPQHTTRGKQADLAVLLHEHTHSIKEGPLEKSVVLVIHFAEILGNFVLPYELLK